VIDPTEVAKTVATRDAKAAEERPLAFTLSEYCWIIGTCQVGIALVTICCLGMGRASPPWWVCVLPNGVMYMLTLLVFSPFRVERSAKTHGGVS
jgi:hypothetical protein